MSDGKRHAPKGPIKGSSPIEGQTHDGRCRAHSSRTGEPCRRQAIRGATVCRTHGGAAPQVQAKAKERLAALAPKAIRVMDNLLERDQFPTVQFQASRFVIEQEVGKALERTESQVDGDITLRWQS